MLHCASRTVYSPVLPWGGKSHVEPPQWQVYAALLAGRSWSGPDASVFFPAAVLPFFVRLRRALL
eukprot:3286578-Lingulodinium_polyedra.AAC.1